MHSTSTGPSVSERGSGLPSMWWPLSRIRVVLFLFVFFLFLLTFLLTVRRQWGRSEQCRWVRKQR